MGGRSFKEFLSPVLRHRRSINYNFLLTFRNIRKWYFWRMIRPTAPDTPLAWAHWNYPPENVVAFAWRSVWRGLREIINTRSEAHIHLAKSTSVRDDKLTGERSKRHFLQDEWMTVLLEPSREWMSDVNKMGSEGFSGELQVLTLPDYGQVRLFALNADPLCWLNICRMLKTKKCAVMWQRFS